MTEKLEFDKAITAIRSGKNQEGQRILVSLLRSNPKNELAWLWLVRSLPNNELRIQALQECLKANPQSDTARRALDQLRLQSGQPPSPISKPVQAVPQNQPAEVSASKPFPASKPLTERMERSAIPPQRQPGQQPGARPVVIRRYTDSRKPIKPNRVARWLRYGLVFLITILLISGLTYAGWFVLSRLNQPQEDQLQQSLNATAFVLETENSQLRELVQQRQTEAADQSMEQTEAVFTPTDTRQPTGTPQPSQTPIPASSQIPSLISPENAASLVSLTELAGESFNRLAYSPDGHFLAAGAANGILVWETETFSLSRQIFMENQAETVSYSPSGDILFYTQAGLDMDAYLYSSTTQEFNQLLTGIVYPYRIREVFVNANGESLVFITNGSTANIVLVDPLDGSTQTTLDHTGGILAASMSSQSHILATGGGSNLVFVWDLNTRQVHTVLSAHSTAVTAVAFSPDAALMASASQDGMVKIWDPQTWEVVHTLAVPNAFVQRMAFTPDHGLLMTYDSTGILTAWIWALEISQPFSLPQRR